jgi:hypothetical protein
MVRSSTFLFNRFSLESDLQVVGFKLLKSRLVMTWVFNFPTVTSAFLLLPYKSKF